MVWPERVVLAVGYTAQAICVVGFRDVSGCSMCAFAQADELSEAFELFCSEALGASVPPIVWDDVVPEISQVF